MRRFLVGALMVFVGNLEAGTVTFKVTNNDTVTRVFRVYRNSAMQESGETEVRYTGNVAAGATWTSTPLTHNVSVPYYHVHRMSVGISPEASWKTGDDQIHHWTIGPVSEETPPAFENYIDAGCITNNSAVTKPMTVFVVGAAGGAGEGMTDVVHTEDMLPGEIYCWEITRPWPFTVEYESLVFADGALVTEEGLLGTGVLDPTQTESEVTATDTTASGGNIHGAGGEVAGGSAPSVELPTEEPQGNDFATSVESAIDQLDANQVARNNEVKNLMVSMAAAEQANFNALLKQGSAEGARAHQADLAQIGLLDSLGGKLDLVASNTAAINSGMNSNGLPFNPSVDLGFGYSAENDGGLSSALNAALPSLAVPAASAPVITIPFSALVLPGGHASPDDYVWDWGQEPLAGWVAIARSIMLVGLTWGFICLFWRTIAGFGGVS